MANLIGGSISHKEILNRLKTKADKSMKYKDRMAYFQMKDKIKYRMNENG